VTKYKRWRCYQQICSEKNQTSGLYLITSPCCWTWWLSVLTWTLKLYSLNVSGNVSLLIYFCWIWELLTKCFYTAFQNNFNSYTNSASQSIESIAKIIINGTPHQGSDLNLLGALSGPQPPRHKLCLHFILYLATPLSVLHILLHY
jgi:hypothetical protein